MNELNFLSELEDCIKQDNVKLFEKRFLPLINKNSQKIAEKALDFESVKCVLFLYKKHQSLFNQIDLTKFALNGKHNGIKVIFNEEKNNTEIKHLNILNAVLEKSYLGKCEDVIFYLDLIKYKKKQRK